MEWINEAVQVEARLDPEGQVWPRWFVWRGERYLVADIGRQWFEEGKRWVLVRTPAEDTFELTWNPVDGEWRLQRVWWRGRIV
ncbi:MAG TPA: hypothetical protein EYP04_08340 [Anaerolineae bacterium]|nr:hypothetical protein [Anaerolineae bacterium]